jgi:hypothetical protein
MSDYADLYMEAFVKIIDVMAKESGFKKGEFATRVWPDISPLVAIKRWQYMRTKSHITGHPQGVLLSDALRMSEILEVDLPYILLKARTMADEKRKSSNQATPQAKPSSKKQPEKKAKKVKAS